MKTLTTTLLALTIISAPATCLANSVYASANTETMPVYEVLYVENDDVIAKQTINTLQHLNYQQALEIRNQAKNNIDYIGARLHLSNELVASQKSTKLKVETAE
ncbi:hypothetical protein RI845_06350 [Thalassotalea nanhaiensis]|uniref:Uncharacterized protein n=1 Tax=Thalassotalea nanhaiensis TaxID=3065648 RepID=A0ABY9TLQ4_9GAMM|nr:hypothetical protein RI845_06350 [Colwelliaceae bacterium SQ345]